MLNKKEIFKNITKISDILSIYKKDDIISDIKVNHDDNSYNVIITINTLHNTYYKNTDVDRNLLKSNSLLNTIPTDSKLYKYINLQYTNIKRRLDIYSYECINSTLFIDKIIINVK